jgi:uncharacterized membrane protein
LTSSPSEESAAAQGAIQATIVTRSGPLPDPRELEYYERVCPGSAQEILNMAKAEQQHRHQSDFRDWFAVILGQILAFILGITGVAGGMFLLYTGRSITGSAFLLQASAD